MSILVKLLKTISLTANTNFPTVLSIVMETHIQTLLLMVSNCSNLIHMSCHFDILSEKNMKNIKNPSRQATSGIDFDFKITFIFQKHLLTLCIFIKYSFIRLETKLLYLFMLELNTLKTAPIHES